jgi:hypothetical protein
MPDWGGDLAPSAPAITLCLKRTTDVIASALAAVRAEKTELASGIISITHFLMEE